MGWDVGDGFGGGGGGVGGRGGILERNDIIARLHARHSLANGFDDAGALVAKDDGEGTFGIFAGEGVCIWLSSSASCLYRMILWLHESRLRLPV